MDTSGTKFLITPCKVHSHQRLPIPCDFAIVCFKHMCSQFIKLRVDFFESANRFFRFCPESNVIFCTHKGINFVVCAEVYGELAVRTIIEELHSYGVASIIGVGHSACIDTTNTTNTTFIPGTNIYAGTSWNTNRDVEVFTKENFISGTVIESTCSKANVWTCNSFYREDAS